VHFSAGRLDQLVDEAGGDVVDVPEPQEARAAAADLPALAGRPGLQVVLVPGVVLQGDADRHRAIEIGALVVAFAEPAVRSVGTVGVDVDVQEQAEQAGVVTLQHRAHAVAAGRGVRAGEPVRPHVVGREDGLDGERHARVGREVGGADAEHRELTVVALQVRAVAVLVDAVVADLGRARVDRRVIVIAVDLGVGRVAVAVVVDGTFGLRAVVVVTAVSGVVVVRGGDAVVVVLGAGAVGRDHLVGTASGHGQETQQGQDRNAQGDGLHVCLHAMRNLSGGCAGRNRGMFERKESPPTHPSVPGKLVGLSKNSDAIQYHLHSILSRVSD